MSIHIRSYEASDYARVLEICVAAFTPIHSGFKRQLGDAIFARQYHDWREQYAETLKQIEPSDPTTKVYVVEDAGELVGFVFTIVDAGRKVGEVGLNAVDPARQGRARGAEVAYVGTGGDDAHAPARAAYKAVGFDKVIPGMHYFKKL